MGLCRTGRCLATPKEGEEAFVVSMSPDQTVRFEIEAFSRPRRSTRPAVGPDRQRHSRGGTGGYLRALKRFVDADGD